MKFTGWRKMRYYEVHPREIVEKLGIQLTPNEIGLVQVDNDTGTVTIIIEEIGEGATP